MDAPSLASSSRCSIPTCSRTCRAAIRARRDAVPHRHLLELPPRRSPAWLLAAVSIAATLTVMTRALYHPLWLLGVLALMGWIFRAAGRRRWLGHDPVPMLPRTAVDAQEPRAVRHVHASSWTGMNLLASRTSRRRPRHDRPVPRRSDLRCGIRRTVRGPDRVRALRAAMPTRARPPALTVVLRPTTPVPVANFNNECYLPIFGRARRTPDH